MIHRLLVLLAMLLLALPGQAQVAYRAASSASSDGPEATTVAFNAAGAVSQGQGSRTVGLPANTAAGHLLLMVVVAKTSSAISVTPAATTSPPIDGWAQLSTATQGTTRASLYYKLAAIGETAPTINPGASTDVVARILGFSGVDQATPIESGSVLTQSSASNSITQANAVTASVANSMVVFTTHAFDTYTSVDSPSPGTWTSRFFNANANLSIAAHTRAVSATGSQAAVTSQRNPSGTTSWSFGGQLVIRPNTYANGALTIVKPAGTVDNDVMVATVAVRPRDITITAPSGWTQLQSHQSTNTDAASVRMTTWYKVAASEGGTYTWTFGGGTHAGAVGGIVAASGASTASPIDVSGGNTTGTSFSHTANSVTTTSTDTKLVVGSFAFPSATSDWSPPSGMTEAADVASVARPSTGGISMEMAQQTMSASGATGTRTATAASSGSDAGYGVAHLVALKPAVVTYNCYSDDFNRASLGSDWTATSSSGTFGAARIVNNRLRLTDASGNAATAAHLQRMFPGAGNKVIVEFDHYAYGGTGADGIAVTLSDAGVSPQAGAYGGSLGYAQRTGVNGFAGGWLGVGIDEYGNFRNDEEGRGDGGTPTGLVADSVSVRGSGSGTTGYLIHAESGTLMPGVDQVTTAISHVGSGVMDDGTGDVTPTLPSHQAGDLLLCAATSNDNGTHSVSTTGWSQVYQIARSANGNPPSSLFYKVATSAAETSPTIVHTGGGGIAANCSAFRGVDPGTPFDVSYAATHYADTVNSGNVTSGSMTTATAGAMMVFLGHINNNRCNLNTSVTGGLSWSQSFCSQSKQGQDETVALHYATKATAGAIGPITFTKSGSDENRGVLVALRPLVAGVSAYRYRITVDHSNSSNAYVTVERNIGGGYVTVIPQYDAKTKTGQAAVPTNWLLSYTGSTGGSTNIHEVDNLSVCTLNQILPMGLDHVRLNHTGSAITCLGEQVTVYACDSADSSGTCTANTSGISGNVVAKSAGGAVLATVPFTIGAGSSSTTVTVPVTTAQTVTFETSGLSRTPTASPGWTCWNGSAASCSNTFTDAGFIVAAAAGGAETTIASQTAGVASGTYYLRAVKTDKTTKACEAALSGASSVDFAYECVNPAACYTSNLLTLNGGSGSTTISRNNSGSVTSYQSVAMTFDANGNAPFTFNYSDAGQIKLYATKAASGTLLAPISGSSNAFVTKPAGFTLTATCTADSRANTASQSSPGAGDPKFCRAGRAFSVTATAVASGGATAYNYGRESVPETASATWARYAPTGAGTSAGNPPAVALAYTGSGTSYTASFAGSSLSWDEVGILSATIGVGDGNYLGAGNVTSTAYVGRFYPDHFNTTPTAQCGGFAYSGRPEATVVTGQPFTVVATAKNGAGGTTANYSGAYAKAVDLTVTTGGGSGTLYVDATAGGTGAIPASKFASGVGTAAHTDVTGRISFVFSAYPTAATNIVLHAEDADTAASTAGTYTDGSISLRAGRLWLGNAYGSDQASLSLPYEFQYWNGNAFVRNSADTCSGFAAGNLGLGNYQGTLTSTNMGIARFAVGANGGGGGTITVTAPGAAVAGSVDVVADLGTSTTPNVSWTPTVSPTSGAGLPWLRGRWYGAAFDRDPTARATFGVFGSSLRKGPIYIRENY